MTDDSNAGYFQIPVPPLLEATRSIQELADDCRRQPKDVVLQALKDDVVLGVQAKGWAVEWGKAIFDDYGNIATYDEYDFGYGTFFYKLTDEHLQQLLTFGHARIDVLWLQGDHYWRVIDPDPPLMLGVGPRITTVALAALVGYKKSAAPMRSAKEAGNFERLFMLAVAALHSKIGAGVASKGSNRPPGPAGLIVNCLLDVQALRPKIPGGSQAQLYKRVKEALETLEDEYPLNGFASDRPSALARDRRS